MVPPPGIELYYMLINGTVQLWCIWHGEIDTEIFIDKSLSWGKHLISKLSN